MNVAEQLFGTKKSDEVIESFIADLKKSKDSIKTFNKYLPFLWVDTESMFTVRNRYQNLKDRIEESNVSKKKKEVILKLLTLDKNFFTLCNNISEGNQNKKLDNKIEFSQKEYMSTLDKFKKIVESKDASELKTNGMQTDEYLLAQASAIYLLFNTGRRQYEIFNTLEAVTRAKENYFTGIVKKRDDQLNDLYPAYLVDEDIKTTKAAIRYIRKNYEVVNTTTFNNNKKSINNFLKKQLGEGATYSGIRDMYGDVAVNKFLPKGADTEKFRDEVLSHEWKLSVNDWYRKTIMIKDEE